MPNKRLFYACEQVGFAKDGFSTYTAAHGVQSVGITTNFNLETAFEIGQLEVYQVIENIPDVEVNMEKVLDGYPLLYHLATNGATDGSLLGRSGIKCQIALSVFNETTPSATGTPVAEVNMSGMFVGSLSYTFPVQGNCTESCSFVGNHKLWRDDATLGNGVFVGQFNNTDQPLDMNAASGQGIQRRQHVVYTPATGVTYTLDANSMVSSGITVLPTDIYGITSSGTNPLQADGTYLVPVQSIAISADLGRQTIFELGTWAPYYKFVSFPVEVRTEIEAILTKWDNISATTDGGQNGAPVGSNLKNQTIRVNLKDGTVVDCGTRNKLSTVAWSGGDAGSSGSNVTGRYSYVGYNNLVVKHPQDPSAL